MVQKGWYISKREKITSYWKDLIASGTKESLGRKHSSKNKDQATAIYGGKL